MRIHGVLVILLSACLTMTSSPPQAQVRKINVAHRGASAYAPEHTLAAYRLALEQGADYVEQDLAVTKDGVLICLHDPTLERTTNVEQLFPDRATTVTWEGKTERAWLANDFTLAEIKRLDAGSWFSEKFTGQRIPTFDEAVALVKGKAGMFPELKTPEVYAGRNVNFEKLVADALDRHRLRGAGADPKTPIILQTFEGWDSPDKVRTAATFVQGLGPSKRIISANPKLVDWARASGLMVVPYTFRSSDAGKFPSVKAEMEHFLYTLNVDGVFTDNPDQYPRR
jgi:glycerophosphoryl diester phosphodiesterase